MHIYINARFLTQKITGVQRYAIELCTRLKKLNPGIKFISPRNIIHKDTAELLEAETFGKFTGHLWEQIELPIYLKKMGNPYIINLANLPPVIYNKTIFTIFDLSYMRNPQWFSKGYYYFYKLLTPHLAKKARMIITISEFSKKEIISLLQIDESLIKVIPCAAPDLLNSNNKKNNNRYGNYILALSSLDPRKNFSGLIKAFLKINDSKLNLVITGSENKVFGKNEYNNAKHDHRNIIFTGYVPDENLPELYSNSKLFIYPSFYEGFGIPPLEAMSCGCPTVVSNTSSIPEVCGDASYYINPYDIDDIAKGISEVYNNDELRNELIIKGFKRVKNFSWDDSAEKLNGILEKL